MFAQVTTLQLQDGTLDAFLRRFQDVIAPDVAMQPGFGGSLLLVDPPRSKVLAVEFWETEADLRTSELVTESGQSAGVQSLFAGPPARFMRSAFRSS